MGAAADERDLAGSGGARQRPLVGDGLLAPEPGLHSPGPIRSLASKDARQLAFSGRITALRRRKSSSRSTRSSDPRGPVPPLGCALNCGTRPRARRRPLPARHGVGLGPIPGQFVTGPLRPGSAHEPLRSWSSSWQKPELTRAVGTSRPCASDGTCGECSRRRMRASPSPSGHGFRECTLNRMALN